MYFRLPDMTLVAIASLIIGLAALLLYFFAEAAFERIFGYIGASAVWLVSFGRIRMDPLDGRESELAAHLGVAATVVVAAGICYIVQQL